MIEKPRSVRITDGDIFWVFEQSCSDGGAHTIMSYALPFRCATCGIEATEKERKAMPA